MSRWLRSRLLTRRVALLAVVLIFGSCGYVLGWSSILTVKHVTTVGAPTIIDRALISQEVLLGERMARVNTRAVAAALKKYSWLKEAKVDRDWFHRAVTITVVTRIPIASIGKSYLDSAGIRFSLPHPERFNVPSIVASQQESIVFAATLVESLPLSFRKRIEVVSIEGLQTATLLIDRSTDTRKRELTVRWGDAASTSLKMRVYQSLLALPENANINFMDISAPHAPIVG